MALYVYADLNGDNKYLGSNDIVFNGTWSSSHVYIPPMDAVNYGASQYIVLVQNSGSAPLGSGSWSELVLLRPDLNPPGPDPTIIAEQALDLANESFSLACIGTNVGTNALNLAQLAYNIAVAGTAQSATGAYNLAAIGTNVGTNALNAAAAAQSTANNAIGGINGVTIMATAGTNIGLEALSIAAIGTNVGTNALNAAALAQAAANSAKSGVDSVYVIAAAGTNLAQEALNIAIIGTNSSGGNATAAYSLAAIGTNVGTNALNNAAAAQASANSAISGVNGVTVIATAGTNLARSAFNIACIGTNVGTNAYNLATTALNSRFDVRFYGAKGDGTTDDTAAFQAAINAAQTAGGGYVYIPEGNYKITSTITVSSASVWIEGAGGGSNLVPSGNFDVFSFTGNQTHCGASNFNVSGTNQTGGNIFSVNSSHRITFRDITGDSVFNAFLVQLSNVCTLDNVWFNNTKGSYFLKWLGDNGHRSDVLSLLNVSASGGTTTDGFVWDGNCQTCRIHALGLVGFRKGIYVLQTSGSNAPAFLQAHDIEIDFPQQEAIRVDAGQRFNIANPYIHGSVTEHGILVGLGVDHFTVTGGNVTGHFKSGIHTQATGVKIVGVEVYSNSMSGTNSFSGIECADQCVAEITGNRIWGPAQQYGVSTTGTTGVTLVGNNLTGNATAPYNDASGTMVTEDEMVQRPYFSDSTAYLGSRVIGISTLALTNNTLYMLPVWVTEVRAFTALALGFVSTPVSANVRLGIYRANRLTGHPTTLIVDAGVVSTGTGGTKTATIAVTLNPGLFFLAVASGSTATVHATLSDALGVQFNGGVNAIGALTRAFTFGSLPADESAQTYTLATGFSPALGIR